MVTVFLVSLIGITVFINPNFRQNFSQQMKKLF